jgi:hypothetical protein
MEIHIQLENLKGTDHLGDLDIDGRIILKLMLGKQGMRGCDEQRISWEANSSLAEQENPRLWNPYSRGLSAGPYILGELNPV